MAILRDVVTERIKKGDSPNIMENAEAITKPFGVGAWKISTRNFATLWKRG